MSTITTEVIKSTSKSNLKKKSKSKSKSKNASAFPEFRGCDKVISGTNTLSRHHR